MRTITILALLCLPTTAHAGPLLDAIAACQGPVALAIAAKPIPRIHPVAKVQPPECRRVRSSKMNISNASTGPNAGVDADGPARQQELELTRELGRLLYDWVAKVQPPDECEDGSCPLDRTRERRNNRHGWLGTYRR